MVEQWSVYDQWMVSQSVGGHPVCGQWLDLCVPELENEEPIINWSAEITERLGSRLYALWNRTAGDCLLDSVLQASWGIFDSDNTLRRALADSLCEGATAWVE